jgi:hypothetical protein
VPDAPPAVVLVTATGEVVDVRAAPAPQAK